MRSLNEAGIQSPTIISGGFPCQPFSSAGQQRGKADDRFLWPEVVRIISELKSPWFVGENVAGLLHMGIDECIDDLEGEGYSVETYCIPACSAGAPHRRDRIFIVANNGICSEGRAQNPGNHREEMSIEKDGRSVVINAGRMGIPPWETDRDPSEVAARLCRMDDGIPRRVDRLRCLGNAVVPQQVYPILKAIAEIENGRI